MLKLPFDLSGCKVKQVQWTSRGVQLILSGETSGGETVDGAKLSFENVANLYPLQDFLRNRRFIEKKTRKGAVLDKKTKKFVDRTVVTTIENLKPYPLKLPATLLQLNVSKSAQASYGDVVFTSAHGKPPKANTGQTTVLFALDEKRFQNRKAFPIVCDSVILKDKRGNLLIGNEKPAATHWSVDEYRKLGLIFFESLATSDLATAEKLLSQRCRKRIKRLTLAKLAGDYLGVAEKMAQLQPRKIKVPVIEWFRKHMQVNVEVDERLIWDMAQSMPHGGSPGAVRASLELCTECLRESLHLMVVEENGDMRIEV